MKKVILASVAIVCATVFACAYLYIKNQIFQNNNVVDKYSYCLHIAMSESRQSGKPIDIAQAKQACERVA